MVWHASYEASTHGMALHERLEDERIEADVDLAAEHARRDVESATDFALRKAVNKLRRVVRELPTLACRLESALGDERIWRDDAKVQEERGDEGGDQRSGGAKSGLVNFCEAHTGM